MVKRVVVIVLLFAILVVVYADSVRATNLIEWCSLSYSFEPIY